MEYQNKMCNAYQEVIKRDFKNLKVGDYCPACTMKGLKFLIADHDHEPVSMTIAGIEFEYFMDN